MNPSPTSDHAEDVRTLFNVVVELALDARVAYLDQACAGDPTLRRDVVALVEAYEATGPLDEMTAQPPWMFSLDASLALKGLAGGFLG